MEQQLLVAEVAARAAGVAGDDHPLAFVADVAQKIAIRVLPGKAVDLVAVLPGGYETPGKLGLRGRVELAAPVPPFGDVTAIHAMAQYLATGVGDPVLDHEVQVVDARSRAVILGSTLYDSERFVYTTTAGARGPSANS